MQEVDPIATTTLGHKIINSYKEKGTQYQRQVLDLIGAAAHLNLGTQIDGGKIHVDKYSSFHPDFQSGIDIATQTMNGFFLMVWQNMNNVRNLEEIALKVKAIPGGWRFEVSETDYLEVILPAGRRLNV